MNGAAPAVGFDPGLDRKARFDAWHKRHGYRRFTADFNDELEAVMHDETLEDQARCLAWFRRRANGNYSDIAVDDKTGRPLGQDDAAAELEISTWRASRAFAQLKDGGHIEPKGRLLCIPSPEWAKKRRSKVADIRYKSGCRGYTQEREKDDADDSEDAEASEFSEFKARWLKDHEAETRVVQEKQAEIRRLTELLEAAKRAVKDIDQIILSAYKRSRKEEQKANQSCRHPLVPQDKLADIRYQNLQTSASSEARIIIEGLKEDCSGGEVLSRVSTEPAPPPDPPPPLETACEALQEFTQSSLDTSLTGQILERAKAAPLEFIVQEFRRKNRGKVARAAILLSWADDAGEAWRRQRQRGERARERPRTMPACSQCGGTGFVNGQTWETLPEARAQLAAGGKLCDCEKGQLTRDLVGDPGDD